MTGIDTGFVELSSAEVIAAILSQTASAARRPKSGSPARPARRRVRKAAEAVKSPCRCGECPACREDARWQRIFEEKFAFSAYYEARTPANWSTLSRK